MTEKRFFILTDDEYDIRPCIRDRTFKIEDIYGDYKYDDLDEICNEFNRLNDENEQLKKEIGIIDEENENLKNITFDKQRKTIIDLTKEIEQLKQFQNKVAEVIESKMGDNVCNDYKMEVLKEVWNELELDRVWFE